MNPLLEAEFVIACAEARIRLEELHTLLDHGETRCD